MKKYNIADQFQNTHRKDMPQTNDYVFRMIYGRDTEESHEALMALLNIVLERKDDPIRKITVKNPVSPGATVSGKETVMDIRAETDRGELLDIEMQSGHLTYYPERTVYYGGKLTTSALQSGEDYGKLKKSIVVSFVDGTIFPELNGCHNVFRLLQEEYSYLLTDRLSLHFVELGKVRVDRPASELTPVERLAAYIKYANDENCAEYIEEILSEEGALTMAETLYRKLTQEEIAYEEMETRLRTEFARNTELRCAREEGLAEGKAEGKAEGLAEGKAEGLAEGEAKGIAEGAAMGQSRFAALTAKLLDAGRIDDLRKATENAAYRDTLFIELGIE